MIKCMSQGARGGIVHIDMPVEDGDNHREEFTMPPMTQVWTSFEISQTLDPGSTDAYTNRINIGETVRFSRANPNPVEFSNVKVMVSAGNREPADYALIRHLNIQGVEFDGEQYHDRKDGLSYLQFLFPRRLLNTVCAFVM